MLSPNGTPSIAVDNSTLKNFLKRTSHFSFAFTNVDPQQQLDFSSFIGHTATLDAQAIQGLVSSFGAIKRVQINVFSQVSIPFTSLPGIFIYAPDSRQLVTKAMTRLPYDASALPADSFMSFTQFESTLETAGHVIQVGTMGDSSYAENFNFDVTLFNW